MEVDVSDGGNIIINWNPKNVKEEITQNLRMILSSPRWSCPMDRDFAFHGNVVDRPINLAPTILKSRILAAIKKYEPRVIVKSITFQGDVNGVLKPVIRVVLPNG